ncbi:hypothetical protein HK103_003674 [Boothiomyces macroporosus]|uniref:Secreted protein n=1 Tax=Boothiomyces macroporosus TaxID=261099 RepID=A0AAD5Y8U2_9FUNG|nr:hypothetical protein HK103_003674 [Boothiomyces macroporosus]
MLFQLLLSAVAASTYPLQCTEEINCDAHDNPVQITCQNSQYDIQKPCPSSVWSSASSPPTSFDLLSEANYYFKSTYFVLTSYSDSACNVPETDTQFASTSFAALVNACAQAQFPNGVNSIMIDYDNSSGTRLIEYTDKNCQNLYQANPVVPTDTCLSYESYYQQITIFSP